MKIISERRKKESVSMITEEIKMVKEEMKMIKEEIKMILKEMKMAGTFEMWFEQERLVRVYQNFGLRT